jgi:hypothetical protein
MSIAVITSITMFSALIPSSLQALAGAGISQSEQKESHHAENHQEIHLCIAPSS